MKHSVLQAITYWLKATAKPGKVIREMSSNPQKLALSFWIIFIFSVLYSLTALLLFMVHRAPSLAPWIPIPRDDYYLYQTFWTIPWGLATWIMISGIYHLLAVLGKREPLRYEFENALVVCSIAWILPSFYLMWIPETFLLVPFGIQPPFMIELVRLMMLPPIWQTALTAIGVQHTHHVGWVKGIIIGVITVTASFLMFLAFMR